MSFYKKYGVRYNFDRAMPDHRYIPDVNIKDRIPFTTKNYLHALKFFFISSARKHPQIYFAIGVPIMGLTLFYIATETYINENDVRVRRNRLLCDYNYLLDKNKKELGAWNSQFNCFENDPWCNRDQQ